MERQAIQYLMNDFVVQEHVCNLRCSYCLNFENEKLKDGEPWKPEARVTLKEGSFGWERAHRALDAMRTNAEAPILRVAGGEVMALPGAAAFVEEVAADWDTVQILTNAVFLPRDIERLSKIENLNLCCSLDGHNAELNSLRSPVEKWANRIVEGVLSAVEAGVPVEIYTVLTKTNIAAMPEFARWLYELPRKADLRFLPFPVRGDAAKGSIPDREEFAALETLLDDYDRLADIMPPRAYLERLVETGRSGERKNRCRIPLSILQSFDDGVLAACTNCWAAPLGNVLEEPAGEVLGKVGKANIHKLFLRTPPKVPFCSGCFTPFDVVNVFLDGECSLEDMTGMHLYSSPRVRERLAAMRAHWRDDAERQPIRACAELV